MTPRFLPILFLTVVSLFGEAPPNWDRWQFLIGEWVGEGGGEPGQGTGSFSFKLELEGRILVRKNRSDYPATKDRAAISHQDLMVVYPENPHPRAIYFDNEGHVIQYAAEFNPGGVVFTSEAQATAPRFRLTYTKLAADKVGIRFEMAPPGKPEAFVPYVEAVARRKSNGA